MERKLRKLEDLAKMDYKQYRRLLKNELKERVVNKDKLTEKDMGFVLIEGEHLEWEEAVAENKEEQPLLYLGPIDRWEKELRGSDLDLKNYAYGRSKVVPVGKTFHIYLEPEKGKLTDITRLKPVDKVFRKFTPKVFLQVVADLSEVQDTDDAVIDENTKLDEEMTILGKELTKYDKQASDIRKRYKDSKTSPAEKQRLLIQYKQILNRLKGVCINWKEDILPHQEALIKNAEDRGWMQTYEKWMEFFDKRQAVKEGKSDDQDALKEEEERLYTKTLEDLDQLYTGIEKSVDLDPSVIETSLNNLKAHVKSWKDFIEGKESTLKEELQAVEEELENLDVEWALYQPFLERYHNAYDALQEAIEAEEPLLISQLEESMGTIIQQINEL